MSIASLVTRGFSNGSHTGSIGEMVTRGYKIGVAVIRTGYLFTEASITYAQDLTSEIGYNVNLEVSIK